MHAVMFAASFRAAITTDTGMRSGVFGTSALSPGCYRRGGVLEAVHHRSFAPFARDATACGRSHGFTSAVAREEFRGRRGGHESVIAWHEHAGNVVEHVLFGNGALGCEDRDSERHEIQYAEHRRIGIGDYPAQSRTSHHLEMIGAVAEKRHETECAECCRLHLEVIVV